ADTAAGSRPAPSRRHAKPGASRTQRQSGVHRSSFRQTRPKGRAGGRYYNATHAAAASRWSVRRGPLEVVGAVDRRDRYFFHVHALQYPERDVLARAAARPHLAIEIALRAHRLAIH